MSDYLGNLIARSRSMVDSIQPRLPSLFEPSHPFADSLPEIMNSHERREAEIVHTTKKSNAIDLRPSSPNSSFVQPLERKIPSASSPLHNIERQQLQNDSNGDRPYIKPPINQNQGTKSIIDHPIQKELSIRSFKPASSSSGLIIKQKTILIPGSDRHHSISQPVLDPQLKMHFHSETVKHHESNQISEPVQSVRVNIGRIEVRAIMPEPMKPRKTSLPAAPTLSLEEYLKQRNGGQR